MDTTDNDLQLGTWLAGAAVGALVMYMLDPDYGAPRRAAPDKKLRDLGRQTGGVLDQAVHQLGNGIDNAGASLGGTLGSVVREARKTLKGLAERELGAPAAAMEGESGSERIDGAAGQAVPGAVGGAAVSATSAHGSHGSHDNQGSDGMARSATGRSELPVLPPSPYPSARPASAVRMAALAGGGLLGLFGLLAPRSLLSIAAGLAGIAVLARASSRQPLHTMLGRGQRARPVEVEKTIRIDASPEHVFDMFADYENFPRFMSNVVQVGDLGGGRSHWIVKGPGGTEFTWTAALTEHDRPNRLSWRSEPGAEVEQNGTITFEPWRSGTRVTVHMAYRPPAGAVGHALARLLGKDPGHEMEEDLARMKMLVERKAMPPTGRKAAATASQVH